MNPESPFVQLKPAPGPPDARRWGPVIIGLVALLAVIAGAAVATGVMDLRGLGGFVGGDASASARPSAVSNAPSASAASSSEETASPDASSGPTSGPIWAQVVIADLPIHSVAGMDAAVVGMLSLGQLVYVHDIVQTTVDGDDWVEIQATPSLRGWVTEAGEEVYHLNLQSAAGSVEWCAVPSGQVLSRVDLPQDVGQPLPMLVLGEVPIPTSLFSAAALGTADLAWADGAQTVCAVLEIHDGAVASASMHADIDTCGKPSSAAYGWGMNYGSRYVLVSDAVLGYAQLSVGTPNAFEIVQLAGAGYGLSSRTQDACVRVSVSGGRDETTIASTVRADVCASVVSVDAVSIVLLGIAPWDDNSHIEFALNSGTEVDPAIQVGATLGMRIESDYGADGALRIRPVAVDGCEASTG